MKIFDIFSPEVVAAPISNNPNKKATFRDTNIIPSYQELFEAKPQLPFIVLLGPYMNAEHYLTTHFKLIREEFMAGLRRAVQTLAFDNSVKEVPGVRNFGLVQVEKKSVSSAADETDSRCQCNFSTLIRFIPPNDEKIRSSTFEKSKALINRSLVLLTCDNFGTITIATVECRHKKHLAKSKIAINVCGGEELQEHNTYSLIESEAYFEPCFQVLKALKKMYESTFPMAPYILGASKNIYASCNLRKSFRVPITVSGVERSFDVLNLSEWPSEEEMGMNASQQYALQAALTKEFTLIQGPPGTGKTFMGLKIVDTFLRNKDSLRVTSPILVMSMTNHALDQFLLGVIESTSNVVRYGGQSKCSELDAYNFHHLGTHHCARWAAARKADVFGITTSAAAREKVELATCNFEIVIVEEAAHVLEAHVVAPLNQNIRQMILIGDHKQLQPVVVEHELRQHHLQVSLFERMMRNRLPHCTLDVQHRMPSQVRQLLTPHIYPRLADAQSVQSKPRPLSLLNTVSFLHHEEPEASGVGDHSKANEHEAEMVVQVAKHLLHQRDYTEKDVTVLTTYRGQMLLIKSIIQQVSKPDSALAKVRVNVVDDFQGEENSIILLSMVRSNPEANIGYLGSPNRVCVALSRAKIGLVIVGNMHTLARASHLWLNIANILEHQGCIANGLSYRCEAHPNKVFFAQKASEFVRDSPYGGCSDLCSMEMQCGHPCRSICHAGSRDHGICMQLCTRKCTSCGKQCTKRCSDDCDQCCTPREVDDICDFLEGTTLFDEPDDYN